MPSAESAVSAKEPEPARAEPDATAQAPAAEVVAEPDTAAPAQPQQSAEPQGAVTAGSVAATNSPALIASEPYAAGQAEVPADARASAEQRNGLRKKLGGRYDMASRSVTRLLSEQPGLRFGVKDDTALSTELTVVRIFADDPNAPYDHDFAVCLAAGLRRLPTMRAVVVRSIPHDLQVQPEMRLELPLPVLATPASTASKSQGAEALIWTTSGRRLDGLLADAEPESTVAKAGDVVLTGHTRLKVLAVESDPVPRLLLAEDGAAGKAVLTRLRAAATARPAAAHGAGPVGAWLRPVA